jgi:hypothetical protein
MSLENIQSAVIDVLKQVQQLSGRAWEGLPNTGIPLNDLAGFDSLCSVEATVMIEERLGCGELKAVSFFISEDGTRPLSILEISTRIQNLISTVKGNQ